MKWKSVTKASDAALEGVKIVFEHQDNSLMSVLFKDVKGNIFRVAKHNYSEMQAFIPAPPETEKKHVLKGTMLRVPVREVFDDSYAAKERLKELTSNVDDHEISLSIEVEDVPVEPAVKPDDGIPF